MNEKCINELTKMIYDFLDKLPQENVDPYLEKLGIILNKDIVDITNDYINYEWREKDEEFSAR